MVKNSPANTGDIRDAGSVPGLGRSPEGEDGNPLQYSCLKNSMDRGAWRATVYRVAKNWTRLKRLCTVHVHTSGENKMLSHVVWLWSGFTTLSLVGHCCRK